MKRRLIPVICLTLGAALAPCMPAQAQTGKSVTVEGIGAMEVTRITATIEAVDQKNRVVTLKGPLGNVFAVPVSDRVKNLAQVKAGDTLEVDYYESVAISVKTAEGTPSLTEVGVATKAAKGEKPGGMVLRKVRVVTNVVGINTETQSILVRGPLGHLTQVKIKDPKVVSSLKAGGQVDLTYVEGLAIAVTGGKKGK